MGLFGRRAKGGRHALGAAVTCIPSAPLKPAAPLPAAPLPSEPPVQVAQTPPRPMAAAVPAAPVLAAVEPGDSDLMTSIAVLLATGEAWSDTASAQPGPPPAALSAPAAASAPASGTTRPMLDAALEELLPAPQAPSASAAADVQADVQAAVQAAVQQPVPPHLAAAPAARRVQLGFRDGTSATLEPGSSQARALEELAQTLTRRD